MTPILAAIGPVFLLILLGFGLKRAGWPGDGFWGPAASITYFILFPALLLRTLATADIGGLAAGDIALVLLLSTAAMTLGLMLWHRFARTDGPVFGSVLQGSIRFNTYLGAAITGALYGTEGMAVAAIYVAIMAPLVNIVAVIAHAIYASASRPGPGAILLDIVRNPLVLACALGAAINGIGMTVPGWIDSFLEILARASLPIGLLCIGAGLEFAAVRLNRGWLVAVCVLKLAVMPALTWILCLWLGLGGLPLIVLVLFNALPAAPTSYVLARQLGGDAPLMAAILSIQVIVSVVTLPLLLAWLG